MIDLEHFGSYVYDIIHSEDINISPPLIINNRELILMPKYKRDENIIHFNDQCITTALLYILFCEKPKLIRNILFTYHVAFNNVIQNRIKTSFSLIDCLCNQIKRKIKKLNGVCKDVCLDEIFAYTFGHEAAHVCFHNNKVIKNEYIKSIENNIPLFEPTSRFREKYIHSLMPDAMTSQQLVELACDKLSLKYLFSFYLKGSPSKKEDLKVLSQILNMTLMQLYPLKISAIKDFDKSSFKFFINSLETDHALHISRLIRVENAANSIADFLSDEQIHVEEKILRILQAQSDLSKKLMRGIVRFHSRNSRLVLGSVVSDETPETNERTIHECREIFSSVGIELQKLLLGN